MLERMAAQLTMDCLTTDPDQCIHGAHDTLVQLEHLQQVDQALVLVTLDPAAVSLSMTIKVVQDYEPVTICGPKPVQ